MRHLLRPYVTAGVAIVAASLVAAPQVMRQPPDVQVRPVRLASVDGAGSSLGDGIALIMGTSALPVPPPTYVDAIDQLYLVPRGFTGTTVPLTTPEGLFPVTGPNSLLFSNAEDQDTTTLDNAIMSAYDTGKFGPTDPIVVFGWSQSADISGRVMTELAAAGVPSDDVHFVLVGDANNADGGLLNRFSVDGLNPQVPALGIPFGGSTPADLYPTDIITTEYAAPADAPQYVGDPLSDINAALGVIFGHLQYPGLTPAYLQNAILLPGSEDSTTDPCADCLTDYYMLPQQMPLLDVLQLIPVIGKPLSDLLGPDLSVLVNLGYGSTTEGWSQGPADVFTPMGLLPPTSVLDQVPQALANGLQQGVSAFMQDLGNPDTYSLSSWFNSAVLDNASINALVDTSNALGYTDATNTSQLLSGGLQALLGVAQKALAGATNFPTSTTTLLSSPTDIINDLSGTTGYDISSLDSFPAAINALLTSLPAYDVSLFTDELQSGNLLDAIGLPLAADLVLIPTALGFGVAGPIIGAAGTAVNLADLIPGLETNSTNLLDLLQGIGL
ncbi:MAG TPA: PE-PPE domain-containing protein [Mycobacterium sp.]